MSLVQNPEARPSSLMPPGHRGRSYPRAIITAGAVVFLLAALPRLYAFRVFEPIVHPDSRGYLEMADSFLEQGRFLGNAGIKGQRPPVYPLFVALVTRLSGPESHRAVVGVQMVLGLATSLAVFGLVLLAIGRPWLAAVAGAACGLDPALLLFEGNVLSETLGVLLLAATVFVFALVVRRRLGARKRAWIWETSLGLLLASLTLTRPMFVALPLLFWVGTIWVGRRQAWAKPHLWAALLLSIASYGLCVGLWCTRNYYRTGQFTVSTLFGCNLVNRVGAFIETADSSYDDLKAIYTEYRGKHLRKYGHHQMAIWRAAGAMCRARDYQPCELSPVVFRMCLSAIRHSPGQYLGSVGKAGLMFWGSTLNYGKANTARLVPNWVAEKAYPAFLGACSVLLAIGMAAYGGALCAHRRRRAKSGWRMSAAEGLIGFTIAVVLYVLVVSSLAESLENSRYRIGVQPLLFALFPLLYGWVSHRCRVPLRSGRKGR